MKQVVVLHFSPGYHSNWVRLKCTLGDKYKLHLLALDKHRDTMPVEYRPQFISLNFVPEFELKSCLSAATAIAEAQHIPVQELLFIAKDEPSLKLAAMLREATGAKGVSVSEISPFINKLIMKEKVSAAGIVTPKHLYFDNQKYLKDNAKCIQEIENKLQYPLFAKKIDSAGSDDVRKITLHAELIEWCDEHADFNNYELDEFITGDLYHIDSIVQNGQIIISFISRYNRPSADLLQGYSKGSITLSENEAEYVHLQKFNNAVLHAFTPLPNGAYHHEVFIRPNGEAVFLEIAARSAGAFIPKMYEKAYGLNIEELHFMAQLSELPPIINAVHQQNAGWIFYPPFPGIIQQCDHPENLEVNFELFWRHGVNDSLKAPVSSADRVLGIVLWSQNKNRLHHAYNYLEHTYKPYQLKKTEGCLGKTEDIACLSSLVHQHLNIQGCDPCTKQDLKLNRTASDDQGYLIKKIAENILLKEP